MLKMVIRFPAMEAELAKERARCFSDMGMDKAQLNLVWNKWCTAEKAAMRQLEEAAFALSMERVRRKSGFVGYYSDHIGLNPNYSVKKGGFEIEGWLLYPELIAVFEDLQELKAFEMHFETESGERVKDDWWRPCDEGEWELYNPDDCELDDYMERKIKAAESFAAEIKGGVA